MNGIELKSIRKENGLILKKFAKMIHTRAKTVSNWENGVSDIPHEKAVEIRKVMNQYIENTMKPSKEVPNSYTAIRHNEPVVHSIEDITLNESTDKTIKSVLTTEDWLRLEDLIARVISKVVPVWVTTYKGQYNVPYVSSDTLNRQYNKPYDPLDGLRSPTPEEDIDNYSKSFYKRREFRS